MFRSGKRRLVAVFALKPPVNVTLTTDASSAVLLDPMGNESPIADPKHISIQAGDYPRSVLLDGASEMHL